ncbi:hypothetical protein PPL_03491, partial [Heterostelium album PN500]
VNLTINMRVADKLEWKNYMFKFKLEQPESTKENDNKNSISSSSSGSSSSSISNSNSSVSKINTYLNFCMKRINLEPAIPFIKPHYYEISNKKRNRLYPMNINEEQEQIRIRELRIEDLEKSESKSISESLSDIQSEEQLSDTQSEQLFNSDSDYQSTDEFDNDNPTMDAIRTKQSVLTLLNQIRWKAGDNIEAWKSKAMFILSSLPEGQDYSNYLQFALDETVLNWYAGLAEKPATLDDLSMRLADHYGIAAIDETNKAKLRKLKLTPGKIDEYNQEFNHLAYLLNNDSERTKIEAYQRGLDERLVFQLDILNPSTLSTCQKEATRLESKGQYLTVSKTNANTTSSTTFQSKKPNSFRQAPKKYEESKYYKSTWTTQEKQEAIRSGVCFKCVLDTDSNIDQADAVKTKVSNQPVHSDERTTADADTETITDVNSETETDVANTMTDAMTDTITDVTTATTDVTTATTDVTNTMTDVTADATTNNEPADATIDHELDDEKPTKKPTKASKKRSNIEIPKELLENNIMPFSLEDKEFMCLVDTGSTHNIIDPSIVQNLPLIPRSTIIYSPVLNQSIESKSIVKIQIAMNHKQPINLECIISPIHSDYQLILTDEPH